jgi:cyanophycin synthetase
VGIVLNVAADHLGLGDINSIDEMAQLKAVIAEAVHPTGYAILNADDERVAAMAKKVKANVAYFSMNAQNPLVRSHVRSGGIAAVYEHGYLSILQQDWVQRIELAKQVPVTLAGQAPFMIANALAASLAAFVEGVPIDAIRSALRSFRASAAQTPGRMNLFNLGRYQVLVDYAHNPAGYEAVGQFVKNWSGPTIGVIGGPGDRRDEDLAALGTIAAGLFDQIVVKEDDDTRGRPRGEAAAIITQGITGLDTASEPSGCLEPNVCLDETAAIEWALDHAPDNSLVVIFPESVSRAIELINVRNPLPEATDSITDTNSQPPKPVKNLSKKSKLLGRDRLPEASTIDPPVAAHSQS